MSFAKKSEMVKETGPTARDFDLESDGSGRVSRQGSVSLSQVAHQRLRHDVIAGVLRPNQRLVEMELSEQLGMSRTPVREALKGYAARLSALRATGEKMDGIERCSS